MAKKRMFNIDVLDTDSFLDMPLSAQALYFWLSMRADDDGFIGNPKRIKDYIGASDDDLKLLLAKKFLIVFEDGVIVIKHWRMHNTIQTDRYHPTKYKEDYEQLGLKENKSYTLDVSKMETRCIQNVSSDLDIDIDIVKERNIKERKVISNADIDFESRWNTTYSEYPKHGNMTASAKKEWMDRVRMAADPEAMTVLIRKATRGFVKEYDRLHPDDAEKHKYLPNYHKFLVEELDECLRKIELANRKESDNEQDN